MIGSFLRNALIGFALLGCVSPFSPVAHAACSPYIGLATINEVNVHNQSANAGPYFVEIKALSNSILSAAPALWNDWTLSICSAESGNSCRNGIPLSAGVLQGNWLVIDQDVIQWDYLDLNDGNGHGMEIVLYDGSGHAVDYLSVDGYSIIGSSGCSYPYDTSYGGGNNFNIQRQPDGVGDWDSSGAGNSGSETENDTNDQAPVDSPDISVSDVTAAAGTSMQFTLELSAPYDSDIVIAYETLNGTAIAGNDYWQESGTVTIPAGETSVEVSIITLPTATNSSYFYLVLTDVVSENAIILNNLAKGTILRLGNAVTHFRMDEPVGSWSGSSGEVLDSGGTSLHGQLNSTSSAAAPVDPDPSIDSQHSSVIGSFCNAAPFDGNSVIEVADSPLFDYTTHLSATAWIYPTAYPGSGLYSILSNDVNYEFHLNSSGKLFWWWQASTLTSAATIPLNKWTHVAITLDSTPEGRSQKIYINGVQDANTNNWQGTLRTNDCQVHIGGDVNTSNCAVMTERNFRGMIDEVKLYDFVLNQSQVLIDMNFGRSCSGAFDHIRIEHDGHASVCAPETVVVKACLDEDCTALYPGSVTVNLSPDGWLDGGSFTFSGGITTRQLSIGTDGNVTLGTTSVSPVPSAPTRCFASGTESCTLNFELASCDFDAVESAASPLTPIYTKLSGVPFSIDILALDDPTTLDTKYKGTVVVDLVDASGVSCPSGPGLISATDVEFKNPDNGRMTVAFDYPNAAPNVRVRMIVGSSLPACSSDNFAIRPQSLAVSSSDANNTDLGGSPTIIAGDPFTLAATALPGYDGTPLLDAALVSGTPHAGSLSGAFSPASAATGIATGSDFRYSEVGHFGLGLHAVYDDSFTQVDAVKNECTSDFSNTLSAGMYGCSFGSPAIPFVQGNTGFGRFIPARFNVMANSPSFAAACNGFTYLEQSFGFLTEPQLTLTALNRAGGVTLNYGDDYWKMTSLLLSRSYSNNVAATASILSHSVAGTVAWSGTGDSDGVGVVDISGDGLTYSKPISPEAPFDADVSLDFSAADLTDADDVCYDPDSDGSCDSYSISSISGTELRYGRLLLQNAYGPETLSLAVPLQSEYYDGSAFTLNDLDNCSTYNSGNLALGPYQGSLSAGDTSVSGSGTLAAGYGPDLILSAPGAGNDGSVILTFDLTAAGANMPWLQYDWDGDGSVDNPSGKATFGIFGGNQQMIYMRESIW
ncbi:MSHA biogenesis protein MshQ [Malonomonas rubra DSM 5091]|uniref:MSHA biogenesis protein MshQ n=1 Tax=Malonomonas rubra DSM 5091 TaxID=1122189 RepID=A0A1M6M749_MALRU|nr:DUF6701 domain-containing protein [Malonomonas rubra]SHJ79063.1 MSHA biogenesis protein MshQ [Malonomonas rubra DSM 5091]